MRLKFTKLLTLTVIAVNLCLVYFTLKYFSPTAAAWRRPLSIGIVSPAPPPPPPPAPVKPRDRIAAANRHLKKMVTVVFRDVHFFDNDLQASIESLLRLVPAIQVLVVYDHEPYPPLDFMANLTGVGDSAANVQFVSTAFDVFRRGRAADRPLNLIRSRYTLLVPDSWRLNGRSVLQRMVREFEGGSPTNKRATNHKSAPPASPSSRQMLMVPFGGNQKSVPSCCRMHMHTADWTLEYVVGEGTYNCDMYTQKHAVFVETAVLHELADPLRQPFPEMLYVQAKVAGIQTRFLPVTLQDGKRLFTSVHNKKRKKDLQRQQFRDMYQLLQIKKVIRKVQPRQRGRGKSDGRLQQPQQQQQPLARPIIVGVGDVAVATAAAKPSDSTTMLATTSALAESPPNPHKPPPEPPHNPHLITTVQFFGCERHTPSCIGTVLQRRPQFVHLGRHTPPCCASKLRAVALHVLAELENVGIRHWLDGAALRSAIDTGALAPDAYEVDVGVVAADVERSESLRRSQQRPFGDAAGFHWLKATDGHYFRVQYSRANRVGVNVLPFELVGDRVRPAGHWGWKAREFSAEFLHPMSSVVFLGRSVMCPNNVKEFLAIKDL